MDSCRSWVVASASGAVFLLVSWPVRLGGQLFVSMLDHFNVDRKAASFPFALAYLMRSLAGPFTGLIGEKFGLQVTTAVGCLLTAVGVGGCYFAEDIIAVDVFLGLIFGFGLGVSTAVVPEILNQHFNKHRAKAMGFVCGIAGVEAFATPPLLEIILETFGVSGTFLIMSAIIFNSLPAAMLLTKPETYNVNCVEEIKNGSNNKATLEEVDEFETVSKAVELATNNSAISPIRFTAHENKEFTLDIHNSDSQFLKNNRKITETEPFDGIKILNDSINQKATDFNLITPNVNTVNRYESDKQLRTPILLNVDKLCDLPVSNDIILKDDQSRETRINKCEKSKTTSSSCASLNVLWSPIFLLITFIQSSHFYVMYISWTIIVDMVRKKHVEKSEEVYFVMALPLSDTIGRFALGYITDNGYMTRANFSSFCFFTIALSYSFIPRVSGFYATMVDICILGFFSGGNTIGLPGIVTEFISKDKRSMAMASRIWLYGPMSFTMSPLIGYYSLSSYHGLFYVLTAMSLLCSILSFLLPKLVAYRNSKNSETECKEHQ